MQLIKYDRRILCCQTLTKMEIKGSFRLQVVHLGLYCFYRVCSTNKLGQRNVFTMQTVKYEHRRTASAELSRPRWSSLLVLRIPATAASPNPPVFGCCFGLFAYLVLAWLIMNFLKSFPSVLAVSPTPTERTNMFGCLLFHSLNSSSQASPACVCVCARARACVHACVQVRFNYETKLSSLCLSERLWWGNWSAWRDEITAAHSPQLGTHSHCGV